MNAQPSEKSFALIERLNALEKSGVLNPREFETIEAEAKTLRQVDIGRADMVLGMLHCLRGDIAAMRAAHVNAVHWLNRSEDSLVNFAISLRRAGLFTEAATLSLEAYQKFKSPLALTVLIMALANLGMQGPVRKYLEEWRRLFPEADSPSDAEIHRLYQTARPKVLASLENSLEQHHATWKSLSNR